MTHLVLQSLLILPPPEGEMEVGKPAFQRSGTQRGNALTLAKREGEQLSLSDPGNA